MIKAHGVKNMSDTLKKIAGFLRSRRAEVTVGPDIEISYRVYARNEDVKLALKIQWEKLLKELDLHPRCIKERKWQSYSSDGTRHEEITIDIEGVIMKLSGPYYPDPDYEPAKPKPIKSEQERANESIDELITRTNTLWAITHCGWRKFEALINFLKATREA